MRFLAAAALAAAAAFAGASRVEAQTKCPGGGEGAKCGGGDTHQIRVVFDEESAKGEITCKEGKLNKANEVEYKKCLQDKLDGYDEIAVQKKIVEKEKLATLDPDTKKLAKKLAFLGSACDKLEAKAKELEGDKEDIEYKKAKGALKKIRKQYKESIDKCGKKAASLLKCPARPVDEKP